MSLQVANGDTQGSAKMLSWVPHPEGVPRADLPDPETVKRQKEQYAADLEEQLRKGVEMLGITHKQQTELLHANANQEKHRYNLVLDQQVKRQELLLSQHYNEQLMRLQQAAQAQRAGLEKQACSLILEYQQRKVHEEFMAQQSGIQKQHQEAQARLAEEMHKLGEIKGGLAVLPTPVVPPIASYAVPQNLVTIAPAPAPPVGGMLQYVPPPASRAASPAPVSFHDPRYSVRAASQEFGGPRSVSFPEREQRFHAMHYASSVALPTAAPQLIYNGAPPSAGAMARMRSREPVNARNDGREIR